MERAIREQTQVARKETLPRLSDMLIPHGAKSFESFALLPSNIQAVESALLFATGEARFVAIIGPTGWGKTHLLESAYQHLQRNAGMPLPIMSAADWLERGQRQDPNRPLLLDNVQEVFAKSRLRLRFRLAIERRVQAGRPTMLCFTEARASRNTRFVLPRYRHWLVATVNPPVAAERSVVVRQIARSEDLNLAEGLHRLIGSRMKGNGRTVTGALKRLRLQNSTWRSPEHVVEACGILNPFFADCGNWDLRVVIDEATEALTDEMLGKLSRREIAVYAMLKVAQLSEAEVAQFYDVGPAQAYLLAHRVVQAMKAGEPNEIVIQALIKRVVSVLEAD